MNGNAELLNFIYQNSEMGVNTLHQLIGIVRDENFKKHLRVQHEEYKDLHEAARNLLNANGFDEKGIKALDRIKTYMMINMQTLTDKSTSHIAEMLILGSTMGVVDATKKVKRYRDEAEEDIVNLMDRLLEFEERCIQELKSFL